jgi:hypothetical protein
MQTLKGRVMTLAAQVADIGYAAVSAAWPRSAVSLEVERLAEHGYVVGAMYDMDFSLSFEEHGADATLAALRNAGFAVTERTPSTLCYVTARRRMPLRAFELQRATSTLQRIVAPYYGYAASVGPVGRVYVPAHVAERDAAREARDSVSRRLPSNAA